MEERMIGTPQSGRHTWTTLRVASLVVGVAGLLTTAACGDSTDLNLVPVAIPSNIVTTFHDSTFNFGALATFAMPDTVVHFAPVVGSPSPISRDFDATILGRVRQDFVSRGYQDISVQINPGAQTPDFIVLVGATESDNYNAFIGYPWFTIWGFSPVWAWYQPGFNNSWTIVFPWGQVVGTTAYPRGTLVVTLIPTATVNPLAASIGAKWAGVATGLAAGTQTNASITAAIDEMFRQSPYLQAVTP
jgi:hypothetical protein